MFDCDTLTIIIQIATAAGECSAALVGALAAIAAFITIGYIRDQNRITEEAAGWSRLFCQISFVETVPSNAKSLLPPEVETLSQRTQLKQLNDVLKRWKVVNTAQLSQHSYFLLIVKSDIANPGTIYPRNIRIFIKVRIPPQPGKNYIFKRDAFTIPYSLDVYRNEEILSIPLENILACDAEIYGEYKFAGRSYKIEVVKNSFNDYDLAFGVAPIAGGENAGQA